MKQRKNSQVLLWTEDSAGEDLAGAWKSVRLGDVAEVIPSGVDKKSRPDEIGVLLCNYLDVYNNDCIHSGLSFSSATATEGEIARCRLYRNDVVITKDSETADDIGKPAVVSDDLDGVVCGYHLAILRPRSELLDGSYLAYVFRSEPLRKRFAQLANGAIRFGLTAPAINSVDILLPSLPEQRAIAAALSTWDRRIGLMVKLITAKCKLKDGLVQSMLSGKQRFKGEDPEFQRVAVGDVVEKLSTAVQVDAEAQYREIGIRSHGKGIFHKNPVLGAVLGEKRVFKVEPGCLTVNIVFAWEQAVAVTTPSEAGFIASHRFPMFKPDASRAEASYLLHYFLSLRGSEALQLASPGGAGRNRTMSQSAFLKLTLPLPSMRFQRRFVALVQSLDSELSLLNQQLEALETQKKGLMRKLLTGEVRVKEAAA